MTCEFLVPIATAPKFALVEVTVSAPGVVPISAGGAKAIHIRKKSGAQQKIERRLEESHRCELIRLVSGRTEQYR
jgi:hypothetical protein